MPLREATTIYLWLIHVYFFQFIHIAYNAIGYDNGYQSYNNRQWQRIINFYPVAITTEKQPYNLLILLYFYQ